jgi:hypothetical protein
MSLEKRMRKHIERLVAREAEPEARSYLVEPLLDLFVEEMEMACHEAREAGYDEGYGVGHAEGRDETLDEYENTGRTL